MSTTCLNPGAAISLHRPWWRRLSEAWSDHLAALRRPAVHAPKAWNEVDLHDLESLDGLSAQTLRDIGAPDWVHERQQARQRTTLELLRL
jgi:hypothetical protein